LTSAEARSLVVDHGQVEVIVLLFLLDRANSRRTEGRDPKDRVEPLEDVEV